LLWVGKKQPPAGVVTGVFLFAYAFLRIFIDVFREYPTTLLGLATGQSLNISMSVVGLRLLVWRLRASPRAPAPSDNGTLRVKNEPARTGGLFWPRVLFTALVLFSLTMPSDWTQDIPARYGKRHPGLHHSSLYPRIDTRPEKERASSGVASPYPGQPGAILAQGSFGVIVNTPTRSMSTAATGVPVISSRAATRPSRSRLIRTLPSVLGFPVTGADCEASTTSAGPALSARWKDPGRWGNVQTFSAVRGIRPEEGLSRCDRIPSLA
jgi:hypothetical protein